MDRVETTQEDDFQWDAQSTCLTSAAVRRLRQNVCTHHVEYWEKHSKDLYRAQPYQKKIAHQGLRFPSHMAWLNQTNEVIPQFWIVNMSSAWVMYVSVHSFFLSSRLRVSSGVCFRDLSGTQKATPRIASQQRCLAGTDHGAWPQPQKTLRLETRLLQEWIRLESANVLGDEPSDKCFRQDSTHHFACLWRQTRLQSGS